jgi:hypothetical protein
MTQRAYHFDFLDSPFIVLIQKPGFFSTGLVDLKISIFNLSFNMAAAVLGPRLKVYIQSIFPSPAVTEKQRRLKPAAARP